MYVDDFQLAGKKQNLYPVLEALMKEVDLEELTSFLDHVYLGCTQRECRISAGATAKLHSSGKPEANISTWSYDMEGHAKKCVERYCELANKTTQQLHHNFKEEMKSVGELLKVFSQVVLKCSYVARMGRKDILRSVNNLARAVSKWTHACHRRLAT